MPDPATGAFTPAAPGTPVPVATTYLPRPRNPRRRGPILFWFTLALAALGVGVLGILDLAGAPVADPAYPALVVGTCGVMLLVGAFYGRAGGLILVGLLAAVGLAGATIAQEVDGADITRRPLTAADVPASLDTSAGEIILDLTDVQDLAALDGKHVELDSDIGRIEVIVPAGLSVQVDANVDGPGHLELFGDERGGIGISDQVHHNAGRLEHTLDTHEASATSSCSATSAAASASTTRSTTRGVGTPELSIDADVSIGEIRSTRRATDGTTSDRPSGRHQISIGHLVMGLAFLGIVGVWGLIQTDTVTGDDIRWLMPIPWVLAGVVGLAATAITGSRRYAVRQTGWVGEQPEQPGWVGTRPEEPEEPEPSSEEPGDRPPEVPRDEPDPRGAVMTTDPTNQQTDQPPSQPTAQPTPPPASPNADQQYASLVNGPASVPRRLVRRTDDNMLGGVCAGLADHLGLDPTLVRVLTVLVTVLGFGSVIIAYLIAWVIVPKDVDVYGVSPAPAPQPQHG